jgi:hypothetical protein
MWLHLTCPSRAFSWLQPTIPSAARYKLIPMKGASGAVRRMMGLRPLLGFTSLISTLSGFLDQALCELSYLGRRKAPLLHLDIELRVQGLRDTEVIC